MDNDKWNVIADRIPDGQGRDFLRLIMQRGNPQLSINEIGALLEAPMIVASAISADAANALMRQLEENGIPARKRRIEKGAPPQSPEPLQDPSQPRYCTRCGAVLLQEARFCTKCGGRVPGPADSLAQVAPASRVPAGWWASLTSGEKKSMISVAGLVGIVVFSLLFPAPPSRYSDSGGRQQASGEQRNTKPDVSPSESTSAPSGTKRAKGGPGCFTKSALSRALQLIAVNDEAAVRKLLEAGLCIAVRPGAPVYVEEFSAAEFIVRIRARGDLQGVWVPIEMVE